jgi:putative acetyltransferase
MLNISQVESEGQIVAARELFREFVDWVFTLAVGHENAPTFDGLDEELRTLPGIYTPPTGRLLLAAINEQPAGCICLKGHDATTCELKRLYVRPAFRGLKIGWQLVNLLVDEARQAGYQRMVLDSHIEMKKAHTLYQAMGFQIVETPEDFPEHLKSTVVFMECDLTTNPERNSSDADADL